MSQPLPGQEVMFEELVPIDISTPGAAKAAVAMTVTVGFHRTPRQRCTNCGQRRVCFYIGLGGVSSPRLCAKCAGIR